jgi:hypothetical protein
VKSALSADGQWSPPRAGDAYDGFVGSDPEPKVRAPFSPSGRPELLGDSSRRQDAFLLVAWRNFLIRQFSSATLRRVRGAWWILRRRSEKRDELRPPAVVGFACPPLSRGRRADRDRDSALEAFDPHAVVSRDDAGGQAAA